MDINCYVLLDAGDSFSLTAIEAADAVLKALHGDEDKDHCAVQVHARASGEAGVTPPPPTEAAP